MALNRSEKINLVQMAMKRVNVVPYGENQIAFGTNNEKVILGESAVTVCEGYINIPDEKHTCESLSAALGLSKVTIRRYLNYLIEIQEMVSSIDYETGGRPRVLYLLKR